MKQILAITVAMVLTLGIAHSQVSSFNTRTGAVTLLSTDVTGALGFTPVNGSVATTFSASGTGLTDRKSVV